MFGRKTRRALKLVLHQLATLTKEIHAMTIQLQKIRDAVAAEKTVVEGAVKLLNSIPDLIRAAGGAAGVADQAALDDLANQVVADSEALKAALVANTPEGGAVAPTAPPADTSPQTAADPRTPPAADPA